MVNDGVPLGRLIVWLYLGSSMLSSLIGIVALALYMTETPSAVAGIGIIFAPVYLAAVALLDLLTRIDHSHWHLRIRKMRRAAIVLNLTLMLFALYMALSFDHVDVGRL